MTNIFEKVDSSQISNGAVTRNESYEGRFTLVKDGPKAGQLTERELELLCDPLPDSTGLCRAILAEISVSNDRNKGGLVEAMLSGNTSDSPEDGMANRQRIQNAIENMLKCGFLKERTDLNGAIESNLDIIE